MLEHAGEEILVNCTQSAILCLAKTKKKVHHIKSIAQKSSFRFD